MNVEEIEQACKVLNTVIKLYTATAINIYVLPNFCIQQSFLFQCFYVLCAIILPCTVNVKSTQK